ncbi:MAG: hypothetical protein AB7D29_09695 [Campylobacterales bacterium]
MVNDLKDSIKAKLYDFNYTPFMSSFVISWIVINHKYLLIFFADGVELREKIGLLNSISLLSDSCLNFFIYPLGFALFYVYIYPLAAQKFYEYTLERSRELKEAKRKVENETPLTLEESRGYVAGIEKLTAENNELRDKLAMFEKNMKSG